MYWSFFMYNCSQQKQLRFPRNAMRKLQWAKVTNFYKELYGNSLVAQWLGFSAFTARGLSSFPGWGNKIL